MITDVSFGFVGGENPLIFVPVSVNGQAPRPFLLDTGAGLCMLTSEFAARLGIERLEEKKGMGAGGQLAVHLGRVQSFALGEAQLADLQVAITGDLHKICSARSEHLAAAVVDFLAPLGRAVSEELHGIVGYNFLRQFRVTIDYPRSVVRFDPTSAADRTPLCENHATCCPTASGDRT